MVGLGYSLTKRFTAFAHFFLGLAPALAPLGAWLAVRGELEATPPYVLAAAVLCWVFGLDLIYTMMDIELDCAKGLFSIPARFSLAVPLCPARILHAVVVTVFACLDGWSNSAGPTRWPAR